MRFFFPPHACWIQWSRFYLCCIWWNDNIFKKWWPYYYSFYLNLASSTPYTWLDCKNEGDDGAINYKSLKLLGKLSNQHWFVKASISFNHLFCFSSTYLLDLVIKICFWCYHCCYVWFDMGVVALFPFESHASFKHDWTTWIKGMMVQLIAIF